MKLFRNFIAIPLAAILGTFTPGLYLQLAVKIELFFWLYLQLIISGVLAGLTTIYIALKVANDENNLLYVSLFLTSLIINSIAIFANIQKDLVVAIPTVLANIIMFTIAGIYPLYMAIKNKNLSDDLGL
jgi:CHASE2 domain-containing sensor protein